MVRPLITIIMNNIIKGPTSACGVAIRNNYYSTAMYWCINLIPAYGYILYTAI